MAPNNKIPNKIPNICKVRYMVLMYHISYHTCVSSGDSTIMRLDTPNVVSSKSSCMGKLIFLKNSYIIFVLFSYAAYNIILY